MDQQDSHTTSFTAISQIVSFHYNVDGKKSISCQGHLVCDVCTLSPCHKSLSVSTFLKQEPKLSQVISTIQMLLTTKAGKLDNNSITVNPLLRPQKALRRCLRIFQRKDPVSVLEHIPHNFYLTELPKILQALPITAS